MRIDIEIKPNEIFGLVNDMLNGKILGSLSRGTTDFTYRLMDGIQNKLKEMDTECETMRPSVEKFFCGYTETEGTPEDEAELFDTDGIPDGETESAR